MEVDGELKAAGDIMSDDAAKDEAEDEAEDEATDDNAWCENFMELCPQASTRQWTSFISCSRGVRKTVTIQ